MSEHSDWWDLFERMTYPDGRVTLTVNGKLVYDGYPTTTEVWPVKKTTYPVPRLLIFGRHKEVKEDFRNFNVSYHRGIHDA